jgi:hypothetical protein
MAFKFFRNPFAVNGDRTEISDETGDVMNYNDGYNSNYELDPETEPDGQYITRDRMNQLFYDITSNLKQWQTKQFPEWIDDSDGTGTPYSYSIGDIVVYTDGMKYLSLVDSNTGEPTVDTANWLEFSFGSSSGYDAISSNADAWGGVATVTDAGETVVGNTVSFTASSESGASVSLVYDNADDSLRWNGDKILTSGDYGLDSSAAWGFIPFVAATGETYIGDSIEFTASSEAGSSFSLAYESEDDGLYWNGVRLATMDDIDAIEEYTLVAGSVPIWYDGYSNTDARYNLYDSDGVSFISTVTAICRSSGTVTIRADFGESEDGAYAEFIKNSTVLSTFTNLGNTVKTYTTTVAAGDVIYIRLYIGTGTYIQLDKWQVQSNSTDHIGQII